MAPRIPRKDYPWWVKLSLWGLPGRAGVWAFFALSVISAIAFTIYGFWDPRFFYGILFLFAALLYWLSIQWVDEHGSWNDDEPIEEPEEW